MKIGDLVKYKKFPHEELHDSGMVGLVLSEAYCPEHQAGWEEAGMFIVDVMWNIDRGISQPAGSISWDYVDEIERIGEDK